MNKGPSEVADRTLCLKIAESLLVCRSTVQPQRTLNLRPFSLTRLTGKREVEKGRCGQAKLFSSGKKNDGAIWRMKYTPLRDISVSRWQVYTAMVKDKDFASPFSRLLQPAGN